MIFKKTKRSIVAVLFFTMLYSCAPIVNVTTDYDKATNFSEFKTFSIYDLKAQEGQVSQLNADRITNAIRSEMIAKGFVESTNRPDLRVNAITLIKNKETVTASTNFYGYGGMYRPYSYWGGGTMMGNTTVSTYNYIDGSLMIDIVSAKTNKLIWQGTGNAQIDNKLDNPNEFISSAVKKIMNGFPPGTEKK